MSKVTSVDPNMLSIMREEISRDVKKEISHSMEESLIEEYREKIRPEIRKIVMNISIEKLSIVRSMERLKEEIIITVEDKNEMLARESI